MSAPWEDYAGTAVVTDTPPWEDFQAVPSDNRSRLGPKEKAAKVAQIKQDIEAKSTPASPIVGKILGALGDASYFVEPYTPSGLMNQPARLAGLVTGKPTAGPFQAGQPTLPLVQPGAPVPKSALGGATQSLGEGLQSLTTPENLALGAATMGMAPAAQAGSALLTKVGPAIGKAIMAYFGTKAATEGIPQAAGEASVKGPVPDFLGNMQGMHAPTGVTPGESAKSVMDLIQQVVVGLGAGAGLKEVPKVEGAPVADTGGLNPEGTKVARPFEERTLLQGPIKQNLGSMIEEAFKKQVVPPEAKPLVQGTEKALKQEPLAGQVSFEGQGIPSAGQAKAMVPDNVLKTEDQLSGTKFYSGVPLPSWQDVKDVGEKTMNTLLGRGVDRPLEEGLRHAAFKVQRISAPHTSAVDEELGNTLIRAAVSRVAAPYEAKTKTSNVTAQVAVANKYVSDTFKEAQEALLDAGVAQPTRPGKGAPMIGGVKAERVGNLWVRKDLAPEVSQALHGGPGMDQTARAALIDWITMAQVIGPTDFVYHTANMYSTIAYGMGGKTELADYARRMVPLTKHVDAIARIGYELYRDHINDPTMVQELADIAKIGALRPEAERGLMSKVPLVGKYLDTGYIIRKVDQAGRLARNKMFDNLVARKLVKDTELDRREFINKMGQYNIHLMGHYQEMLKRSVSPFAVAGTTMNYNGLQQVLMMNEVRAASPAAYARMKMLNIVGMMSSALSVPIMANLYFTGRPFGRPGTPIGMVDFGPDHDTKDGKHKMFDPSQSTLVRRGVRITGLQALGTGVIEGQSKGQITKRMEADVMNGLMQPWAGPAVRAAYTGITGKELFAGGGKTVSKDPSDLVENLKAALIQMNPGVAAVFAEDQEEQKSTGSKAVGYLKRLAGSVGYKESRLPTHVEKVEAKEKEIGAEGSELQKRGQAERALEKVKEFKTEAQTTEGAKYAMDKEKKLSRDLEKALPKEVRDFADKEKVKIPSYDGVLHQGKTRITLKDKEAEKYKEFLVEEYTTKAKVLMSRDWTGLTQSQKQTQANDLFDMAKKRAESRLRKWINEGASEDEKPAAPKGKRFSFLRTLIGEE